jgi:hypothetical protein
MENYLAILLKEKQDAVDKFEIDKLKAKKKSMIKTILNLFNPSR